MVARAGDAELELGFDAPVTKLATLSRPGHGCGEGNAYVAVGFLIWYSELTTAVHSFST